MESYLWGNLIRNTIFLYLIKLLNKRCIVKLRYYFGLLIQLDILEQMKVTDILKKDFIISELKGKQKEEVINELIDLFKKDNRVNDIEKVRSAVLEREKIMSTGVGKGFAIPHGKTDGINEIIAAFGKTNSPIEYQALDNKPVNLVFLLIGKDNLVSTHIKLLSRISRMMNKDDFREGLLKANSSEEIFDLFKKEEENYFEV
jgi:fructose PTS system EIIBC or EIIC component